MSTKYNKIKSNALNKAKKVRTEQAQAKAKKYNKKVGKADIAYINGDLRKASSMRAYGIKKQRAEGNQVYGYDNLYNARDNQVTVGREKNKTKAKYLYTNKESVVEGGTREDGSKYDSFKTRKRLLSDDERNNFAKYGDTYDKDADKKKYKLFNSANKDADSYLEHFNTGQWDGVKTAKARIKDQNKKGISKLVEYGIGLGKDILADPVVDAMRVADAVGGAFTAGGLGTLENMENILKGHKVEEDLTWKNFKDSLNTSNKTGWSKGSSEFMTEKDVRQFEKDKAYYNNDAMLEKIYGTSDLEEFKKKVQKDNNWAGLIWDFIGDPVGIVADAGKLTAKAGKKMLDGTADISTAIKSKHLDDIFFSSKPYEDLKLYDNSGANKIHNQLDNGYNRAVSNDVKVKVKEKVSTSSYTPFLASYLDELDNSKPLTGKQLKMDGRALNKKWTQTKAPIEPYKIQEVDPVIKGAKVDTGRQMTMFGKDGDISKGYLNSINNPNGRINKILDSYDGTNIDEFIDKLDNLDDATYDRVMDLARVKHPELYNKLVEGSDEITDAIEGTVRRKDYVPQSQARADKKYFGTQSLRKFSDIPEANGKSLLENYNEFNKSRIGKTIDEIAPRSSIKQSSLTFEKGLNSWVDKVSSTIDDAQLNKIADEVSSIKNADIPTYKKVEMLNEYLFNGKQVIRTNLPQRNIDNIIEHLEEVVNTRTNNKTKEILGKGKFFGRSSTDVQFEQKMSDIASYMGVANKSEFTVPYKKLEEIKKTRPLTTDEYYEFKELGDKIREWDNLYREVANMGDEYAEYAQKKYGKENPLDGFNKVVQEQADMKRAEKLTAHDIEQEVIDELNELGINDLTQKEIDDLVDARVKEYYDEMNHNKTVNHIQQREMSKLNTGNKTEISQSPRVEQANLNQVGEIGENLNSQVKSLRKQLNLPEVKAPGAKVKLTKGQKLRDLPPVKESLKNLRSVIEKEVDYMYKNPNQYKGMEKAFKQIKTDYVNTLRQMGVPDDKYFHKVKALQDELKATFEKGTKSNSPLVKMNLQHLARRISETFDEIDNIVLDNIGEKTPLKLLGDVKTELVKTTNPFDRFMNKINTKSNLRPQSKLPDPKYKLTKDKDLINLETGETKPFFDRHTTQEEYNEKIHGGFKQKNIEEYERLQKYVDNPDKYGIYDVMNLMDSMNIKFDPNDAESMDKALNKFFWIIEKKGIVPSSMKNAPQPNKSVKDMRNLPTNELKQLSDETKGLVNNPMSLVENRALQDRNRDEIIDNARKMYEREDKESLFDRLFQQADTKEKMKGVKPLFEQVDEYSKSSEGLKQYYTNLAKNDEVMKNLKLADKGIDVSKTTTNKTVLDKMSKQMNKHQFDPKTKRNYEEVVRQAIERGEIDEKIAERLTPEMLEKVMNSDKSIFDIKFKSDKQIKAENQANMTRELHKKADDYVAKQDKDTFGIRKKPKKVKQTEDIKPKTKEELLNDELSVDSIGKDIEKDIKQHQKENRPVSFEKFKSWLNNDEAMFYEDTKLYNAYKSWLNSYKKGLTVYNPGWHVQNYFQNKGQNYLALGMDAFKPQTNAKQIIKEMKGKPNKAKNVGKYTPQQIAKMAKDMNIVEGLGVDVQQTRGIFPKLENKIDNTPMMKKLMENEKTARLHHFITQIENGMTPEKAMKSVNDTLFDYSKANKVDKVISDFVDPFWTFHKNNATLMGKSAFSPNSGRLNKVRKFHENLDDTQEKEVKQNYGKLYGNHSFVDDVNGDTYNFLYKEGMMPDIANALPLSQEEVENKLNPILRLLAQQSRGEGNFGNKLVEGDEAGWGEVTKDERVGEVIQELNPFMPGLVKTLVKNHNTQKKTGDEKQSQSTTDKQIFYDWLSYITGFKGNYYREIK